MSTIGEKTQAMPSARASTAPDARDRLGCLGIPACRHGQRHGKRGAVAVNDIEPKKNGDVQPRFFHRDVLVVICLFGAHHIQHRAHLALGNQLVIGQV